MQTLSLSGEWLVRNVDQPDTVPSIPARVPGCIHMDLLAANQLEDPNYRDNEKKQFWVGETGWTYERSFSIPADILRHDHVLLRCHGLDTLAALWLNDTQIGQAYNMFRTWEYDVKALLKPENNVLTIQFAPPMPYVRKMDNEKGKMAGWVEPMRVNSGAWIRKEPCNFGWDWGPELMTVGIWREIELVAFDTARLNDVRVLQDHDTPGKVTLEVSGAIEQLSDAPLTARVEISYNEIPLSSAEVSISNGAFKATLTVENPKLWWINGFGEQHLYRVTVQLVDEQRHALDTWAQRIGLRVLRLERNADQWGESFHFSINGTPFFAKGANWIPADPFAARVTKAHLEKNIRAAVAANMNMLRVWGGGIYEEDMFYDLCDELGIAVWQDFIFACGTYPSFDDEFMANVTAEAGDNVRRIRHHASLALWCGNNEIEQGMPSEEWQASMSWADYSKLFDDHLYKLVQALDPQRDYWPGSPHVSLGERTDWMSEASGDSHLWMVWHGRQPFEWYRTRFDRFVSEFGFQSFPEPRVIDEYTLRDDQNITSYIMEYHQRSGIGNSVIIHYLLDWFRLPSAFESLIWLSQILHAMAMKYAIEHWRRNMPRTMGALYWQLNDCWPGPSWASLDYHGNWKALHYFARRFFAPLMISGVEDPQAQTVQVYVTCDVPQAVEATARWKLTTSDGQTISSGEAPVSATLNSNTLVATIDCSDALDKYGARNLLVWLALDVNGEAVSENLVHFARPKHMELPKPNFSTEVTQQDSQHYEIRLSSPQPALFVWLEVDGDASYSDNFFHLPPGQTKTVTVTLDKPGSIGQVNVRSLTDTY